MLTPAAMLNYPLFSEVDIARNIHIKRARIDTASLILNDVNIGAKWQIDTTL